MSPNQAIDTRQLEEGYAVMDQAGKGSSQFVIPGRVRAEIRDSERPGRALYEYVTGDLLTNVLDQLQGQLDTLISPGGTAPPYLAKHLHIAELIELARAIQTYAGNVTPKQ